MRRALHGVDKVLLENIQISGLREAKLCTKTQVSLPGKGSRWRVRTLTVTGA